MYVLSTRIALDVFLNHKPAQWGVNKVLRIGPAEYFRWVVTPRKDDGALTSWAKVQNAGVYNGNLLIPMEKEIHYWTVDTKTLETK